MDDPDSLFKLAVNARRSLNLLDDSTISFLLEVVAKETENRMHYLLAENQKDLQRLEKENPKYDRLLLTEERLLGIVNDLKRIAQMPSPIGINLHTFVHENGMQITKKTVPFGVVGVVYEARPNVSFDVFALCFKSKNVCVLKGGSDAKFSNEAIINLIREILDKHNVNANVCILLDSNRETTDQLLKAREYIDLIIPRGSKSLIDYVRENSCIPMLETGAGVCHTYFDQSGDVEKGRNILFNAKTRRVSVCNSLDCLIINKERLSDLPHLCENLKEKEVIIYADKLAYEVLSDSYPSKLLKHADDTTFGTEFLDYKMAIKTVLSLDEAIDHISIYGSKHSESIVSENTESIELFENLVDAACVYANVSTAFTDGGQFGFGAEIGISTQKMHARGPMALNELCSYKWIIEGDGQVRP